MIFVERYRYDPVVICHLGGYSVNNTGRDIDALETDVFHPFLGCQGHLQLIFVDQSHLEKYFPQLYFPALLFLDPEAFMNFFSGQNAHFYQNPAKRSSSQLVYWREMIFHTVT